MRRRKTKMKPMNIICAYAGFLVGCIVCDFLLTKALADMEDNYKADA